MDLTRLQKVALAISILIIFTIVVSGLAAAVMWVIAKILKWILSRKPVQRMVSATQQKMELWWDRNHTQVETQWEFLFVFFIDPLCFTYAVFVLYNKFASLTEYTYVHPEYNFWQLLNQDMEHNMSPYFWFMVVFYIWMFGKIWILKKQNREQRVITKILESNTQALQGINQTLQAINKKLEIPDIKHKDDKSEV